MNKYLNSSGRKRILIERTVRETKTPLVFCRNIKDTEVIMLALAQVVI